jgi:hypothetical protein
VIGHAIALYVLGRDDARYGRGRGAAFSWSPVTRQRPDRLPELYSSGYADELERMRHEQRLAQLELPLER